MVRVDGHRRVSRGEVNESAPQPMITTTRDGKCQALSVDGGPTVALLDERKLTYALRGQEYVVRRVGNLTPAYELWRSEDRLASLTPHWPRDRYTLTVGGRTWTLQ